MMKWCVGKNLFRPGPVLLAAIVFCCVSRSFAQQQMPIFTDPPSKKTDSSVKLPEYEVASVRENKSDAHMMRMMTNSDGFSGTNLSLQSLIADAYGIKQDLISGGPGWVESNGFDVDAKVAGTDIEQLKKLTGRERASMLQPILAERFKLKVHIETKELPIYELVVMKSGVKVKEAAPDPPSADPVHTLPEKDQKDGPTPRHNGMMRMGPGEFTGFGLPMTSLANELSYVVHHTVLDKTGLTGKYDVNLTWAPDRDTSDPLAAAADTAPSFFTAFEEELGLKLQPGKDPVDTLVIDQIEQPSEN